MNKVFFLVGSRPSSPVPEIHGPFATKAEAAAGLPKLNANPYVIIIKSDLVEVLQTTAP